MDQMMLIVVVVALLLAVVMSVVAMRLLGRDRQRHAARVAALEAAAQSDIVLEDEPALTNDIRFDDMIDRGRPHVSHVSRNVVDDVIDDARQHREPIVTGPMFAATEERAASPRRWIAVVGVAAVMVTIIGIGYTLLKPAAVAASGASSSSMSNASGPASASGASASAPPIELLSLRHSAESGAFTVTGLVQNPLTGAAHPRVIAIVYLFDQSGAYFASGKAELEFRGLRPGEESPFTIRVPSSIAVTRYRVGFRADDGSVVAHVDRRGQTMAGLMTEGRQ